MNCPKCGVLNLAGAKFCTKCGMYLEDKELLKGSGPSKTTTSLMGAVQSSTAIKNKYEILNLVKEAEVGSIYIARDKSSGKEVIFKRFNIHSSQKQQIDIFLKRSLEIQGLHHKNLASTYHVGHDEEGPFVVTEKVDGKVLKKLLDDRGPFSLDETVSISKGIASALAFAHKKGLYHSTLNPYTVIINSQMEPKVVDFCVTFEDQDPTIEYYLAPEQRKKQTYLDFRVDIYALGALLYKMHTGLDPDPILIKELPLALQKVVEKATEEQRENRFSSMEDLFSALSSLNDGTQTLLSSNSCPMCGTFNSRDSQFCSHCGAGLVEECPHCHHENKIGQKTCLHCGVDFTALKNLQTRILNARSLFSQGNIEEALSETQQALSIEKDHEEALQLKERFENHLRELEQEVAVIEALIKEGVFGSAFEKIKSLAQKYPNSNMVVKAFKALIEELHRSQYDFSLSELFDLVQKKDFQETIQRIEDILKTAPSPSRPFQIPNFMPNPEGTGTGASTSITSADTGKNKGNIDPGTGTMAWHRFDLDEFEELDSLDNKRKTRKMLAKAKKYFERSDFVNASKMCKKILQDDPYHSGAKSLMKKALKKGKALKKLLRKAKEHEDFDELKKALALLKKALKLAPKHRGIRDKISRLRSKLDEDLEIDDYLEDDFYEDDLLEEDDLDDDWDMDEDDLDIYDEKEEEIRQLIDESRQALKNSEFGEAYRLAKKALDLDPNNRRARELHDEAKDKGIRLKEVIQLAKEAEEAENFVKSLALWREAQELAPRNEIISKKIDHLQAKQEMAKKIPELLKEAQKYLAEKDYREALIFAQDVLKQDPSSVLANQIRNQAQEAMDKTQELILKGRKFLVDKNFEDAISVLEEALELYPLNREARELLSLAKDKYEAGDMNFDTIDMEILLGTHSFPSESGTGTHASDWEDDEDDFVSTGRKAGKENYLSRPNMREIYGKTSETSETKVPIHKVNTEKLSHLDEDELYQQFAELASGDSFSRGAAKKASPSKDPAINVGDEFTNLRRQREQKLKDDHTTTFSSVSEEEESSIQDLLGIGKFVDSSSETNTSSSETKPQDSLSGQESSSTESQVSKSSSALSDLDPEDLATEKIPNRRITPEVESALENLFGSTDTAVQSSLEKSSSLSSTDEPSEEELKEVRLGIQPGQKVKRPTSSFPLEETTQASSKSGSDLSGTGTASTDEVASLLGKIESSHNQNISVSSPLISEEDSLRSALNKAIEEVDNADFAATDKINVNDISRLGKSAEEEGLPLSLLGTTSEIHRPMANQNLAEGLQTEEIHRAFDLMGSEEPMVPSNQETIMVPTEEENEKKNLPNLLDEIFESSPEETQIQESPEGKEEISSVKSSIPGDIFDDVEESNTEKIQRNVLDDILGTPPGMPAEMAETIAYSSNESQNLGLSQEETEVDFSKFDQMMDFSNSTVNKPDSTVNEPDTQEAPSEVPVEEEVVDTVAKDEDFLGVLEKALGESSPEEPGPSTPVGKASTGEINAFMSDYQVTSELEAMDLKEAKIHRESSKQKAASSQLSNQPTEVDFSQPVSEDSNIFDFDWSPDENGAQTGAPSHYNEAVQDLFPGMKGVASSKATQKDSTFIKRGIKLLILLLFLVILGSGGVFGWLYYNFQEGEKLYQNKKYKAAFQKLQSVEYSFFVPLVGEKRFSKLMRNTCLKIGEDLLKRNHLDGAKNYFQLARQYSSNPLEIKLYLQKLKFRQLVMKGDKAMEAKDWQKALQDYYFEAKKIAASLEQKKLMQQKIDQVKKKWIQEIQQLGKKNEVSIQNKIREFKYLLSFFPKDSDILNALKRGQFELYYQRYLKALTSSTMSLDEAIRYLEKASSFIPGKRRVLCQHCIKTVIKDVKELFASKAYEEALEKLSFLKQYQNVLGADLEMLKSLEDKIQYEYHLFLAKKAKQEKKWTKVIKELAIARQHGPDTLEILNWRREAKSELLKVAKAMEIDENWVEASKLYTLLVKYFPNDKKIQKSYKKSSYEFYLQKGNLNFAEIEWGMAYENYKKALQFNPKDTKILGRLKLMAHEQERYKKYKQFYRLASQLEKQKNWKEALEYYTKARKEMGILGGNARGLKEKIRITKKKWLEEQEKGYALYFNRGLKKLKSPNPYSATRDFEKALYYKQGDAEVLRYLAFAKTLKNMVYVPAGYFIMGRSRKDAQLDQNQTPENRIYLPGFYIDKYEVTNRQYRKFLTAIQRSHSHSEYCHPNEPKNKDHTPMYWTDPDYNQDDQPVVGVDWYDAYAFAKYVGKRLPTEQQWEKAARGSDGRLWPWGNKWNPNALNHYTTGPKKPTVVGSYPLGKSPYGCYDMAGNVWEWTDSKYAPYPNSLFKVPRKERNYYILRGGSWNDNEIYLADIRLTMTVFRFPKPRSLRGPHIGFRCVKLPLRQ